MSAPTRPALRYHGGKWRLAPWIIGHFPAHRCYVEPYGGGASVLLRKPTSDVEVYNDLDEDVNTFFRVLRSPTASDALARALRLTPFSRVEFEDAHAPTEDPVERARRLVVRSFMGFGSSVWNGHATGFRDYTKDHVRRRYPAGDWSNYPDCLGAIIERFRGVVVETRTALELLPRHDGRDTLWYVDPPYVHTTRASTKGVRQKYAHEMTDGDHQQLADALHAVRGFVVLSGYDCDLYRELYAGWETRTRACMADGANPRTETLWLNPSCATALGGFALSLETAA